MENDANSDFSLCEECDCLISTQGLHSETCSRFGMSEILDKEHIPEDINLPGDQLDKSPDHNTGLEHEHIRIKICVCPICQEKCNGTRGLIKHTNACHPTTTTHNDLNDDENDATSENESEVDDCVDEGIADYVENHAGEERKKSRKRGTLRSGRGTRYTLEEMKILKAALNNIEDGLDVINAVEDVSQKTNLNKNRIKVSKKQILIKNCQYFSVYQIFT